MVKLDLAQGSNHHKERAGVKIFSSEIAGLAFFLLKDSACGAHLALLLWWIKWNWQWVGCLAWHSQTVEHQRVLKRHSAGWCSGGEWWDRLINHHFPQLWTYSRETAAHKWLHLATISSVSVSASGILFSLLKWMISNIASILQSNYP